MAAHVDTDESRALVALLADAHLIRYRRRLALAMKGVPGYRRDELVLLVTRWEAVVRNHFNLEGLPSDVRDEVRDAMEDVGP